MPTDLLTPWAAHCGAREKMSEAVGTTLYKNNSDTIPTGTAGGRLDEQPFPAHGTSSGEDLVHLCAFLNDVVDQPHLVATNLLARFGSISSVLVANAGTLATVEGLSTLAVQLIRATQQLVTTAHLEDCFSSSSLPSPAAIGGYLRAALGSETGETIRGLFLNRTNGLISEITLAPDRPGSRVPCKRFVARHAVACGASGIILARTDPENRPRFYRSELEDILHLSDVLAITDVALYDYILIGRSYNASAYGREAANIIQVIADPP